MHLTQNDFQYCLTTNTPLFHFASIINVNHDIVFMLLPVHNPYHYILIITSFSEFRLIYCVRYNSFIVHSQDEMIFRIIIFLKYQNRENTLFRVFPRLIKIWIQFFRK